MDKLKEISRGMHDVAAMNRAMLLVLVIVGILIVIFVVFYRRMSVAWAQRRGVEKLFLDLCQGSGLGEAEQDLLLDMADFYGMGTPGVLFVSPSLVRGYATNPAALQRHRDAQAIPGRVRLIAEKLFGAEVSARG